MIVSALIERIPFWKALDAIGPMPWATNSMKSPPRKPKSKIGRVIMALEAAIADRSESALRAFSA